MKVAMLLVSMLFLATAVEALPGAGGRQLAKGKKPNKKCKVDVCWKKCQKLKDKEEGSVLAKVLGSKCDIAFMEDCLEGSSCKADCKDVFNKCRATVQVCKKNLKTCMKECKPKTLDCSKTKGEKKKKCCEKKCEKSPDVGCIETCIAA